MCWLAFTDTKAACINISAWGHLGYKKTPLFNFLDSHISEISWPAQRSQHAMKPDIWSESGFLPTPRAFGTPIREGRGFRQNIAITFGTEKLEWCGYPKVKKLCRYVYAF